LNQGAAAARNLGVNQAKGEKILFVDADCVPNKNWIETIIEPFGDQEIIGVKGVIKTEQTELVARFTQIEYEDKYDKLLKHRYIDFIDTASAAYRRATFLENGGFDADLHTVEDVDLSFRLAQKGYKMVFAPRAIVYHRHPRSILDYGRRKYSYGYWRVFLYKRYPQKMVSDSRTPQTQKIQIGLLVLFGTMLVSSLFWSDFLLGAAIILVAFLISTLPFCVKALRRDPVVGLISPALLLVRAGSLGLGLGVGIIYQLAKSVDGRECRSVQEKEDISTTVGTDPNQGIDL